MIAVADGCLTENMVKFSQKSACCVVMASDGYPVKYESGFEITVDSDFDDNLYVAGAKLSGDKLLTAGGRVLGVTAVENTLSEAIKKAYSSVKKVRFANAFYRNDIGAKAMSVIKEEK